MKTLLLLWAAIGVGFGPLLAADAKIYRSYAGQVYEVTHSELWQRVGGRVIQVIDGDMLLLHDPSWNIFAVRHCPVRLVDGDRFRGWVIQVEPYEYTTVLGVAKTVRCFDFGELADAPPPPLRLLVTNVPATNAVARMDAGAQERRLVEWTRQQATAGLAWAQYDLGIRLRDGRGLPADQTQARRWLNQAADQGHTQARAALALLTH